MNTKKPQNQDANVVSYRFGENDDLEGWRHDHQKYFERTGGFDPEMMLVCERFKLIDDLES